MNELMPQNMRRRWRPWKVLLGLLAAMVIAFFCYQWFREWEHETRLREAIAATDQIDPGWRLADMVKEYQKLPMTEHFKPPLLLWKGYMGWAGDDISTRPGAIPYDPEGKDFAVRFPLPYFKILKERLQVPEATGLKVWRDELTLLDKEPWICQMAYDDNNMVQRARTIANYLYDEIELAAHDKNYADLPRLVRYQLRLSRYCLAAPRPINHLVGMALRNRCVIGLSHVLALGEPPAKVLAELQELLAAEQELTFEYILRSARADKYNALEKAQIDPVLWQRIKDELMATLPGKPNSIHDRLYYFWKWLEVESAMRSPALAKAEILEIGNVMIALIKSNPAEFFRLDPGALPRYEPVQFKTAEHLLAKNFVSMCFKLVSAEAATRSQFQGIIVALACERYRQATGHWPTKMVDLQPEYLKDIPIDPYIGQAMLYRVLNDGIVAYGVGTNGIDDGGDVLYLAGAPKDRGVKLLNPDQRDKKFEDVYPDRARPE